ncbi:MAG: DUF1571 domain-containing protein [Bacteroidales bacterium]|nr:DUF1571 domain-containing protein [Bacteroidales bacterium]MBN2819408.1 DUF1571 domain-containing protein [Bacteroidales bacterium]
MFRRISLALLFPLLVLSTSFKTFENDKTLVNSLIKKLIEQKNNTHSVTLTMIMKERIENAYLSKKATFKINYNPYQVYLKQEYPNNFEVLFKEGENNEKAWVKPSSFPWTTISLNPTGKTMRENNHHSIYKAGFRFIVEVFEYLQSKYKDDFSNMFTYNGLVKYNNLLSHKFTFENPNFSIIDYNLAEGSTLEELSDKLKINDYMVTLLNPELKDYEEIPADTKIKIPTDYSKKIVAYIDIETGYFNGIKAYDENGLWEEYTYVDLKINPNFTELDFDLENPVYSF